MAASPHSLQVQLKELLDECRSVHRGWREASVGPAPSPPLQRPPQSRETSRALPAEMSAASPDDAEGDQKWSLGLSWEMPALQLTGAAPQEDPVPSAQPLHTPVASTAALEPALPSPAAPSGAMSEMHLNSLDAVAAVVRGMESKMRAMSAELAAQGARLAKLERGDVEAQQQMVRSLQEQQEVLRKQQQDIRMDQLKKIDHDSASMIEQHLKEVVQELRAVKQRQERSQCTEDMNPPELTKELQNERQQVAQMLSNVKQEKLDVIAVMHGFHVNKTLAMQELDDLRRASLEEMASAVQVPQTPTRRWSTHVPGQDLYPPSTQDRVEVASASSVQQRLPSPLRPSNLGEGRLRLGETSVSGTASAIVIPRSPPSGSQSATRGALASQLAASPTAQAPLQRRSTSMQLAPGGVPGPSHMTPMTNARIMRSETTAGLGRNSTTAPSGPWPKQSWPSSASGASMAQAG